MPNQKGNLKDRLRSWNLFLKYKITMAKKKQADKKRKKKLEKEMKKNLQLSASGKYYSKPKIVGLTITGLFLGIFESKSIKNNKINELENKVSFLENQNLTLEEQVDIINGIEVDIIDLKYKNQFDDNIKKRIKNCENKLESLKNSFKNSGATKFYTPILEIKVINKELKDYQKKLKQLKEQIKTITEYNDLYELDFSLKQTKLRLGDLLVRYDNIKELPGFSNLDNIIDISDIDIYNLRYSSSNINIQIQNCDNYLKDVDNKRVEILNNARKKEEEKETKKEEEKKEKENQKEKKKRDKKREEYLLELSLANKMILDNIAKEKKNISKFKRSISKLNIRKKRRSIFVFTKNILATIINFSMILFPFSIFKNKLVAGLTGGIMINNSLRSVRRILNPELESIYILFNDFEKELNSASDYLKNISYVCNDSLNQINQIRNTIYLKYGNDLEYSNILSEYLKDLDNIESQVLGQREAVDSLQNQIKVTKTKNKQKVKEWKS